MSGPSWSGPRPTSSLRRKVGRGRHHNDPSEDGPPAVCPFCERILAGECEFLDEHPGVVAFAPLNPVVPGHLLFVPERHVADAAEDPALTARCFEHAARWGQQRRARGRHGLDFNLIVNCGEAAGQTVRHLHVHLVPRRQGDGLKLPWSSDLPKSALAPRHRWSGESPYAEEMEDQ